MVVIKEEDLPANTNQAVAIIRVNEKLDTDYLFYYLNLKSLKKYINFQCAQSVQANLNLSLLGDLPILYRNLDHQKKIAKVLADIDNKIELNSKINSKLESMAKLIYDYWFVQFDFPDEKGRPYKSSGGKMVYNDELKREIPEGWKVANLLEIASFTNGIACQKYRPNDGEKSYSVIKIREMKSGFTNKSELVSKSIPEKVIVNDGDILFSWSASLDVMIWSGGIGGLNQHIFKVTSDIYPRTFLYFEVLKYLEHFKMVANSRKTTMGHITRDHLEESRICVPPVLLIEKLHNKVDPLICKIVKANQENNKLVELRDWLLPMLMNGQITVK